MTDYELPALDYDFGALEPHYSARVLELHHEKHHAAYVAGLNQTLDRLAVARRGSLSANGYSSSSSMTTTEMSARAPRRCS